MKKPDYSLTGPALLSKCEDNWHTAIGASFPREQRTVLRGKDLLGELNDRHWMELWVYAITGRESPKLARLVESMWVIATSFPDPRLWNNRVAALGGTARTTGSLAVSAASAVSEANAYGVRVGKRAIDMLYRIKDRLDAGAQLEDLIKEEFKKYRVVSGYGRPLVSKDERVEPLINAARSAGYCDGPYLQIALEISEHLSHARYKQQLNVSAIMAAILADEGISASEAYYLVILCFSAGILPCYIDAIGHPQGTLFPLSTYRINYQGHHQNARCWNQISKARK